jgi:hypothetical protein
MKDKITLFEFLFHSIDDDTDLTDEYLQNAQIDTEEKTLELKEYIKRKKEECRCENLEE